MNRMIPCLWVLMGALATSWAGAATVVDLRCEYRQDPLGIDAARPRLSWVINSDRRGAMQSAYQVLVASTAELLAADKGDLWDSGKVESDQSNQVEYTGQALVSHTRCFWKVRVWDNKNEAAPWSSAAQWTMGILKPEDWTAQWISTEVPVVAAAPGAAPVAGKLTIRKATWAALDGAGSADVTARVAALVKDGRLSVPVDAAHLGDDPAMMHAKQLRVEYELNGEKAEECAEDFQTLELPSRGTQPPEPLGEPYLRRTFTLASAPQSALATVNVMGYYELYVNGTKVGSDVMSPALSNYNARSLYLTYDVKPYLHKGKNCLGLWTSRGWYWKVLDERRNPGVQHDTAIARVQLDMVADGKPIRVGTDANWRCKSSGRRILNRWSWNAFGGERVDARRADPVWANADTDESLWYPVTVVSAPAIPADAQGCPPMAVLKTIPAVACKDLGKGGYELDFGTCLTGWLKLRTPGLRAGQGIWIEYADRKDPYQTFTQRDEFISAGRPDEEFCSKFNYHGFRYAILHGLPDPPALQDAQALLIGTDWERRGDFACSNDLFNHMHQVNLLTLDCLSQGGYMSDCPHRERLGYGDGQVSIESCIMNFWMPNFYEKWAIDWADGADPQTGELPHTAPQYKSGGGGPPWGGAAEAITWRTYLNYCDKRIVTRQFEACRGHIRGIEAHAKDGIVRAFGGQWDFIGDWVPPGRGMDTNNWPPKPAAEFFINCYRLYLREQLAQMADILGRHDEAEACRAEIQRLRPLIHEAFYDKARQLYVLDEQSYQLMPLMTGVVPEELRPTIMKKLEAGILVKNKGHLDTGMLGTYFLLQYLQETGRNDLLYTLVNQRTYPGWGSMLEQGATTWWEQWNGFFSRIHSCFTSLDGWFYRGLAGIRPDVTGPGFKKIIIKPAVVGDLTWVTAHYDSIYGRIGSAWKREGDLLSMDITIPANTSATVYVPAAGAARVTESGKPAAQTQGVKFLRLENGAAVYEVGSGVYKFRSSLREEK